MTERVAFVLGGLLGLAALVLILDQWINEQ